MFYLLTVRREKDLYKMRLCTACTVHEHLNKLVITPYHTVPSLIPTMREFAQVFANRKKQRMQTTAVYLSLRSDVIYAAGLQW